MRRLLWIGLVIAASAPLAAQRPLRPRQQLDREALQREVIERFMENYRVQAGLTPQQNERFRQSVRRLFEARRERQQRERGILRALEEQMRPGVAANSDSLTRLLDALTASRQAQADLLKAEQAELSGYLNPVQRAQLVLQLERFQRNLDAIVRRRLGPGAEDAEPSPNP